MIKRSLSIVRTLHDAGFRAYFAGGYVRDRLLGIASSDIDIATDATPKQVQELFPGKTLLVGALFGVVVVVLDKEPYEVATFRSDGAYVDGRHPKEVHFSSPEEDAKRRDFTINGMFYDPLTDTIFDFVGGKGDLARGVIRAIGEAKCRFEEDRLRMIRAVRFAVRFDFTIEEKTYQAIEEQATTLLPAVSVERIWQELSKMTKIDAAFLLMFDLGLLQTIFPELKESTREEIAKRVQPLARFPKETPTIVYLRELLQKSSGLVEKFKASKRDQKLLDFFETKCEDLFDWLQFYKNPDSALYLAIEEAKGYDLEEHLSRKRRLDAHLVRETPLITSTMLRARGVEDGPRMGILLRVAERLAVNEDLSAEEALDRLLS